MPTSAQQEQPEAAPLILELLGQSPSSEGTALMLPAAAGWCLSQAPLSLLSLPQAQPQEWLQEGRREGCSGIYAKPRLLWAALFQPKLERFVLHGSLHLFKHAACIFCRQAVSQIIVVAWTL